MFRCPPRSTHTYTLFPYTTLFRTIGTIIKPSVGPDPEATAAQVAWLLDAGIDFIKDDELQSDGPACPFEARVAAVMRVINDHAERTGKKVMYRSEEHTSELQSLMRTSYAVFCLKKKKKHRRK